MPMLAVAGMESMLGRNDPASFGSEAMSGVTDLSPERHGLHVRGTGGSVSDRERRFIREPYRQAFGRARTEAFGRPAGWILAMSAVEKVFFPVGLLIMVILGNWEGLAVTVAAETTICLSALALTMKGQRMEYALKGLLVTPIRYALLGSELFTIGRFASDLWITKDRKWRK